MTKPLREHLDYDDGNVASWVFIYTFHLRLPTARLVKFLVATVYAYTA